MQREGKRIRIKKGKERTRKGRRRDFILMLDNFTLHFATQVHGGVIALLKEAPSHFCAAKCLHIMCSDGNVPSPSLVSHASLEFNFVSVPEKSGHTREPLSQGGTDKEGIGMTTRGQWPFRPAATWGNKEIIMKCYMTSIIMASVVVYLK